MVSAGAHRRTVSDGGAYVSPEKKVRAHQKELRKKGTQLRRDAQAVALARAVQQKPSFLAESKPTSSQRRRYSACCEWTACMGFVATVFAVASVVLSYCMNGDEPGA